MPLPSGELHDLIDVQQYSGLQDSRTGELNEDDGSWSTTLTNIFANVRALSGRAFTSAMGAGYVATHRVQIRWMPGILPRTTRFIFEGLRLYVVHPANPDGKKIDLDVLCLGKAQ